MKKLLFSFILFSSINSMAQRDCITEYFATVNVNYVLPKSFGAGVDYFTKIGLTGGVGAAYTNPKTYPVKMGENSYDSIGNSFDIYAYVGYRVWRIDYVVSTFFNAGYTMGNAYKLQPFTSIKILFPIDQKAISIEPVYIFGRGISGKVSFHIKL